MIQVSLPGRDQTLELGYLLLDGNGTLTIDGMLLGGIKERIEILKEKFSIYLLTADTFGSGEEVAQNLGIDYFKVSPVSGAGDKRDFMHNLGARHCVAIGNGFNDMLMLEQAGLSIIVVGKEGCSGKALARTDIVVNDICDALDLLINPLRLVATLRG